MEETTRSRNSSTSQSQDVEDLQQDIPYFGEPPAPTPRAASASGTASRTDFGTESGFDTDLLSLGKTDCNLAEYDPSAIDWDPDTEAGDAEPELAPELKLQPKTAGRTNQEGERVGVGVGVGGRDAIDDVDGDDSNGLDDSYPDENESSVLGSDYGASGSGSAANSYYQSPTPSNCELMLRPPSSSVYHFNYRSPASPVPGMGMPTAPGGSPAGSSSSGGGRLHPYAHSPGLLQGPHGAASPSFYPNMWYPNSPYSSAGAGSGVGVGVGVAAGAGAGVTRYGGYGPATGGSPGTGTGTGPGPGFGAHTAHRHPLHHQYPHMPVPHPHQHSHSHHHPQLQHQHPHPHPHQHQHPHPHETMMEMFQLSNSGREARNRAEKNRRDKLNGSIQELSTMVPHVAESPRRVDKTAVLRFAAHGLRLKHAFGKTLQHQRPQITDTLMGMLDSFFLTVTCHGHILLISSSIEQHLGHCQTDLYGQSIMQITHPEDQNMLKQQLIPTELENLFDVHAADSEADGEPRLRSKSEEDYIDRKLREDRRSFRVRLARAGPRSEPTAYEVVKIDGCFRRSDDAPRGVRSSTFSSSLQLIRRTRGRDDVIPLHTISGNDIVLTGCARIIRPPKIASRLIDANSLEYRTRHLIDGRIIDCDQRIGIVAGYMTDEVRNLSPFTFMHNDDVRWVIVALRQMYDCNSSYGESTYRLFTRNGNIIYLQSKGYLEIDKETNKVHSFVCVNTLLDDEEGKRRVQEMKKKFSVIINTQIPQSTIDVPASEHPALLEKAVMRLIQNLQKSNEDPSQMDGDEDDEDEEDDDDDDEDDGGRSMSEFGESYQHHHHSRPHHSSFLGHSSVLSESRHGQGSSKTPPLALVPPEAASVKSSISKSISVVNVTVAKHLRSIQSSALKSPSSLPECTCHGGGDARSQCDLCQVPLTPDPNPVGPSLKRSSSALEEPKDVKVAKRCFMPSTEIEHVLNTSLDQIGRKLSHQLNVARNLRDQGNRYELPHANQRFDEIMQEHQKQSELFVNIKSEYEVQLQNKANNATATKNSDSEPHRPDQDLDPGQDQARPS
ncbi:uncharacterized protein LOC108163755 isoform X1 [Drosophila miranda]|uniref:uncharacterized protein LOC108163755 isoform X1 n=2 Tax=Drosophila miranda TaxID=7229 RepID=UPI0007E68856|nr:uncharacterized protein LOC108163755 isoform X1 [Drosophila miranda]XP_017154725.1 uncharacterized protein LOC108163755 isoform X1 [Drosophila miranda]XP_017154733.1 uncharacterized protein LOC108163755 isoform X1 [Drosophila miranda]